MSSGPISEQSGGPVREMTPYRKVTFVAIVAFVLDILIGAGFANMSASDAPTALETDVVRWVALICLAVAGAASVLGRRLRGQTGG